MLLGFDFYHFDNLRMLSAAVAGIYRAIERWKIGACIYASTPVFTRY